MLSAFFESVVRVHALRAGPAGALLERFAGALSAAGYAQITARRILRAAEHFTWWAARHGLWTSGVTEQAVDRFRRHVPRCRCGRYSQGDRSLLHSVRLFVRHLGETGVMTVATVARPGSDSPFLAAFGAWMREQRGTCEATLDNYASHIRELLKRVGGRPDRLDAQTLRQFVLEGSRTRGWAAAKKRTTALRMFLRFLISG